MWPTEVSEAKVDPNVITIRQIMCRISNKDQQTRTAGVLRILVNL